MCADCVPAFEPEGSDRKVDSARYHAQNDSPHTVLQGLKDCRQYFAASYMRKQQNEKVRDVLEKDRIVIKRHSIE